jgi:hypothetical protein
MQKTDSVEIPNVKPKDYFLTLRQIYGRVRATTPNFKAFRQWMREKGWWNKEQADGLMFMLDLSGNPVALGPFAAELADQVDEAVGREAIGKRLIDLNPLLAKYCLEAMDVENDGRIQSTRELFKLVDSFVYPGKKPKLTEFAAWMAWAEAGNLVRLIGIRWGLSDFARQVLPKLRAIDPDEFLEDEEDAPSFAEVGTGVAAEPSKAAEDGPSESVSQPEPVREPTVAPQQAQPQPAEVSTTPVPVMAPEPQNFYVVLQPQNLDDRALRETRDEIRAWWQGYPSKRVLDFGLLKDLDDPETRLQAFYTALGIGRGHSFDKVMITAGTLKAAGVFQAMAKGRIPVGVTRQAYAGVWDLEGAQLVDMMGFVAGIAGNVLKFDFTKQDNPLNLLDNLNQEIFKGLGGLAPFVVVRIAVQAGVVDGAGEAAGFIPFFHARQQAFRMGFVDRIYCNSFRELAEDALALAGHFGRDMDYEQPLTHLPGAFGCAFGCGNQGNCPFKCREKTPYNG